MLMMTDRCGPHHPQKFQFHSHNLKPRTSTQLLLVSIYNNNLTPSLTPNFNSLSHFPPLFTIWIDSTPLFLFFFFFLEYQGIYSGAVVVTNLFELDKTLQAAKFYHAQFKTAVFSWSNSGPLVKRLKETRFNATDSISDLMPFDNFLLIH